MFTVLDMSKEFFVGKNIILRAAIALSFYSPYNKKTKFTYEEKEQIGEYILQNNFCERKTTNPINEPSNSFIDISDIFLNDFWKNTINSDFEKIRFVDLFSGAGGICLGFVMSGMHPVANFEIFKAANETYEYNFKKNRKIINHPVSENDISNDKSTNQIVQKLKQEKIDIIVGGFPCQGFSVAGIRSLDDPRNDLYKSMAKMVNKLKPKFVVMENVPGLLSMKDDEGNFVIDNIIELYKKMGYKNIAYRILNAADYGVPQNRKRLIILANRTNTKIRFPKPILDKEHYVTCEKALKKYEKCEENLEINHIFTKHQSETIKRISKLKSGESLYANFSDAWKKIAPNKPSPTIKENHGGVNIHYKFDRVITPREMASLQSFPDDFIFKGTKSQQLIQIGNAVPPLLSKAIACAIKKMMEE